MSVFQDNIVIFYLIKSIRYSYTVEWLVANQSFPLYFYFSWLYSQVGLPNKRCVLLTAKIFNLTYLYCKMLTRRIVLPRISLASIERALWQLFLVGMVTIFRIVIDCHNKNVRIERHRIFALYDRLLVDVWFHQESRHRQSNNDNNKETPFLSQHFPWISVRTLCCFQDT